jgi:Tfp pilus assembly protein PilF
VNSIQGEQSTDKPPHAFNSKVCIQSNFQMGLLSQKAKDTKQAAQFFKQCLVLDQSHFGASIHLANLLTNQGDF